MKRREKYSLRAAAIIILFSVLISAVSTSCDQVPEIYSDQGPEGYLIGSEGGIVEAMEGNVILDFPPGAVSLEKRIYVVEGPYVNHEFVLKSLEISPLNLEYHSRVKLIIRCDGCINNGEELKTWEKYVLYYFPDEKAFYLREPGHAVQTFPCSFDPILNIVEGYIAKNGIFAVGMEQ